MPRPRREEMRYDFAAEIKSIARQQMSRQGTTGLSLRAVARELGVTAPAIYNYFPRLDDLITALIVDAFTDLAVAMESAAEQIPGPACLPRINAVLQAYRNWARSHPVDFQLIYGNPIPGYHADPDLTTPLAFRPFKVIFHLYSRAIASGELHIPQEYQAVPPTIAEHLADWKAGVGLEIPDALVCLLITGWGRIHGLVLLELFGHSAPVIGDPAALYQYELDALHHWMGAAWEAGGA